MKLYTPCIEYRLYLIEGMRAIYYTEAEICYEFKKAKHPNAQIRILAELNAVPTETIREILRRHGLTEIKRRRFISITDDEGEAMRMAYESGKTLGEVAILFHRRAETVSAYGKAHGWTFRSSPCIRYSPEELRTAVRMREAGASVAEIAAAIRRPVNSVYKFLRDIKTEKRRIEQ